MKKRILSIILAIGMSTLFCIGLVSCNKCSHAHKTLIEDTTTCERDGVITYRCKYCDKIITETGKAKGHEYILVSDTSTCINSGIKTSRCKHCEKVITESVEAKGHNFSNNGLCTRSGCSVFKYNIELSVELPKEFRYVMKTSKHIYSKFLLTKVSFKIEYGAVYINFEGKKTYDENGAYGNERIYCKAVLKESDTGRIIGSDSLYASNLVVGQTFKNNNHKICKVSDLDAEENYILEIVDEII